MIHLSTRFSAQLWTIMMLFSSRYSLIALISLFLSTDLFSTGTTQQQFIRNEGGYLTLGGRRISLIGANSYYLTESLARGDSGVVTEIFSVARTRHFNLIRTWGFNDGEDTSDSAVIQLAPYRYNEHALRALDLVLNEARQSGVFLLLPLVNNWDDYGGMDRYVRWYATDHSSATSGSILDPAVVFVSGARGQRYAISVGNGFVHDDFYRLDEIKSWYKAYVSMLLLRVNTVNGCLYKDDPTIAGWELANEPRSSDKSGALIRGWLVEMSAFVKSLDPNHLVGTGEEGFDITNYLYSPIDQYNDQSWLFDGSTGSSFRENIRIPTVDFSAPHLYPWRQEVTTSVGKTWIADHCRISQAMGKSFLLGEFGSIDNKTTIYHEWCNCILHDDGSGGAVWDLVDSSRFPRDTFAISLPKDDQEVGILSSYSYLFSLRDRVPQDNTESTSIDQIYPNPVRTVATIRYHLSGTSYVRLIVYDILGRTIDDLAGEIQSPGSKFYLWNSENHPSGIYFYRLETVRSVPSAGSFTYTGKIVVLK